MRGKNLSPFDSIKINLTDSPIAERRSQNVHVDPINCPRKAHSARRKRERERENKQRGKSERERDKFNDPHNQVIGRDINHNYQ